MMKTRLLASSSSSVQAIQRRLQKYSSSSLVVGRNARGATTAAVRSFHSGSVIASSDALDMTDTFARRHSKCRIMTCHVVMKDSDYYFAQDTISC